MSATILAFTRKPTSASRIATTGEHLRVAYPVPPRDAELDVVIHMASGLLSSMTEQRCDRCLDRLERWEADNRA